MGDPEQLSINMLGVVNKERHHEPKVVEEKDSGMQLYRLMLHIPGHLLSILESAQAALTTATFDCASRSKYTFRRGDVRSRH
uniref:Uncharacterized protein n=1 Tax=Pristionchus pacificus TaxID=54126 RepID=A0A2A6BTP5_PRIPA|eukprot:PDM69258.1 hypothetical protein PRIPAC_47560 [Pristionchus pacificus]